MRSNRGHLASRRSDLQAAAIGAMVALLVACAGYWTVHRIETQQTALLGDSTDRLGYSVARAVAATVERGLSYGIPFDQLYGVSEYLDEVLAANPEIAAIWIRDPDGLAVYGVERNRRKAAYGPGRHSEVGVWVTVDERRVVLVTLETAGTAAAHVVRHQYTLIIALSLAAGVLTGLLLRISLIELWDLPRSHLMASLNATARGVFADFSRIRRKSPISKIGRLAAEARAPVRATARDTAALRDELQAIDLDGSLTRQVTAAVGALFDRYRFERPARLESDSSWSGWANLLLVMVAAMSVPLVGGFAADRVGFNELASASAAAALGAEGLGALIGLLASRPIQARRSRGPLVLLAVALAGGGTILVAGLHDLTPFIALRFATSLCLWFAVGALLPAPERSLRTPWLCGLLLLIAISLAPLSGDLLADGLGRRDAFLAIGLLVLLFGIPLSLQPTPTTGRVRKSVPWLAFAGLASATAAVAGIVPFYLGAALERHDYALTAACFGVLGGGIALGLVLRWAPFAAVPMALAAASVWLPLADYASIGVAMILLGIGVGCLCTGPWRFAVSTVGLLSGLAGLVVGPALSMAAISVGLDEQVWMCLLLALPLLVALVTTAAERRTKRWRAA